MSRTGQSMIVALGAMVSWLMLGQLILVEDAGDLTAFDPWRLLLYVLLVAAPVLTFVPIARWAHAPFYDIEATVGWATLGFVVAIVTPADPPTLAQFLVFLLPLTVALATLTALVSTWLECASTEATPAGTISCVRAGKAISPRWSWLPACCCSVSERCPRRAPSCCS
jgi:ABC-type multidrug transport system permease subunit